VSRKWAAAIACLALTALPTPGGAAGRFDLHLGGAVGASYVRVVDPELADSHLEDVQGQESVATTLVYDNAYMHVGVHYRITAVQLAQNAELNYLDHRVGIRLDADRWMQRLTDGGRLSITANLSINPSLPPLDPNAPTLPNAPDSTPPADGTATDTAPEPRSDLLTAGNIVNIRQDRSGYAFTYGLTYEDDTSPFSSYRVGWRVTDHRYNSDVVGDSATLRVGADYLTRVRIGHVSVGASHGRFVRGGNQDQQTYGLHASLARTGYRLGWRVSPGLSYRTDRDVYGASLDLSAFLRRRILSYQGSYNTDYEVLNIGDIPLARTQRVGLTVQPTRRTRFPRRAAAAAVISRNTRAYTLSAGQAAVLAPNVNASIGYERGLLRWTDSGSGILRHRHSDTVLLALNWQFL